MPGLGRGFESLIPTEFDEDFDSEFDVTAKEDAKESDLKKIKIADIVRDEDQPRKEFNEDELKALSNSIKEHGVLQPLLVVKEGSKYKIVAGERRWRALLKTHNAKISTRLKWRRLMLSLSTSLTLPKKILRTEWERVSRQL